MAWAIAAQVGIGALSSWLGGGASKYIAKAQQAQQQSQAYLGGINEIKQLSKMLDVQGKQNDSLMRSDLNNFVNTQYQSGLMSLQDALSRKTAARNRNVTRRMGAVALSEEVNNAAATGTIGASVNAVVQNIQRNTDQGVMDVMSQRELERNSNLVGVYSLYTGYSQNQAKIDDTLPDVPENPRIYSGHIPKNNFGSHLLSSAVNVGLNHVLDNFSLGLGKKQSTAPSSSGSGGGNVKLYGLRR